MNTNIKPKMVLDDASQSSVQQSEEETSALPNTYALALEQMSEFRVSVTKEKRKRHLYRVDVDGLHCPKDVDSLEEAKDHIASEIGSLHLGFDLEEYDVADPRALEKQYRKDCIDVVCSDLERAWDFTTNQKLVPATKKTGRDAMAA